MSQNTEMEISLRSTLQGNSPKEDVVLTVFKPDVTSQFKIVKISPCPEWLGNTCSKCGSKASSSFYEDDTPTMLEIDGQLPLIFCDECREKQFKIDNREMTEQEVPPNKYRLVLRGRIEWSVNRDNWYSVKHINIIPYSFIIKEETELIKRTNVLLSKMYRGNVLRGKAKYTKATKILELNIDTFS